MVNITLIIIKEEKDSKKRILKLKKVKNLNEEDCSICLNKLHMKPSSMKKDENNIVFSLPCEPRGLHIFHRDCITSWLRYKNTCPLCKFEFDGAYKCFDVSFPIQQQFEKEQQIKHANICNKTTVINSDQTI